jgi:hypothetical protein
MESSQERWWVQLPNGAIDGPFAPEKVVSGWKGGKIPPGSAFSNSKRGPWWPIRQCVGNLNQGSRPEEISNPVKPTAAEPNVSPTPELDSPPPLPISKWYIARSGEREGPFTEQEVEKRFRAGAVDRDDLVWTKGMTEWVRAGEVEALADLFVLPGCETSLPPPLPPPTSFAPPVSKMNSTTSGSSAPAKRRGTSPVAWVLLAALVLGGVAGPALFHLVSRSGGGYYLIPKRNVGYADTFISVDTIISRYNNQGLGPKDPVLEYLANQLEQRGAISSRKRTWNEVGDAVRDSLPDR